MMKRSAKRAMGAGAVLILGGLLLFAVVMGMCRWDFTRLGTRHYETNIHTISDDFSGLSLQTGTAGISFVRSEDGICRVECHEEEKSVHTVDVREDTLHIGATDERKWYDHIGLDFDSPQITVYLPKEAYDTLSIAGSTGHVRIPGDFRFGDVDISISTGNVCFAAEGDAVVLHTSTGNLSVQDTAAASLDLSVSTGRISLDNVICEGDVSIQVSTGKTDLTHLTCTNLTSRGSTGDISLDHVAAEESISVCRTTGHVDFSAMDAAEIFIETGTGDVSGSLLSPKVFTISTHTGNVELPDIRCGGICEITTSTGDIRVTMEPES